MINLMFGDCLDRMKEIPDGSVNLIATDLPYGTTQCKWDSVIPLDALWKNVEKTMKWDGVFLTTSTQPFASYLLMSRPSAFRHQIVWVKGKTVTGHLDAKRRPMRNHELVMVFSFTGSKYTYNPIKTISKMNSNPGKKSYSEGSKLWGNQKVKPPYKTDSRYPKDVIYFEPVLNRFKSHSSQKPVGLYEYLVRTYSNDNDTVLDVAMGSGTTGEACINTGRNFIGIENYRPYYDIACERLGVSGELESWGVDWDGET